MQKITKTKPLHTVNFMESTKMELHLLEVYRKHVQYDVT